jgi:hypothetical protein
MASVGDMHDSSSNSTRQRELSFDSVYSDDDSQCSDSDDAAITSDKRQTVSTQTSIGSAATTDNSNDVVLDETTFSELVARFSVDADEEVPEQI